MAVTTNRFLNTRETADRLNYSVYTVRELARAGVLPSVRFTERGQLRFASEDVDALIARLRTGAAA
jgi:excisionase family DNA binding protein